ncbi:hypothetical protein Q0812_06280 [Brevundimonas sp. 2R-24]|uniref:Peptidase M61 catalytic domain-containing protein n=1 Tax=Peiella sedimenti TaxID=3061083 RepID=A0ABT8SKE2_9CAUL|nr:hypothetical protein [Caulobacteraceae bacterium XZ-24]
MRQAAAALVALTLACAAGAAAATPAPTLYEVTPEPGALRVSILIEGDRDGETELMLPNRWSGAEGLWRAVEEFRVEGAEVAREAGPFRTLNHAPGAALRVTYRVRQAFEGPARPGPERPFRPVINETGFTAVGWTVLAVVADRADQPAVFRWGEAPEGWTLASDLDHRPQVEGVALMDSVLIGGADVTVAERQAAGGRIRVAAHAADWRFAPDELTAVLGPVAEASARFWGDEGESFFVALTPLDAPTAKVQFGVGLGDGFSLWVTPNMTAAELRHILAHEHQHAWLPDRVGGLRRGPDEALDYWFSEGFTELYTLRMLVRAGLMSPEDFAEDLNRSLSRYALSPARNAPAQQAARAFWGDPAAADLPYQRGLVLALAWDARLKARTGGRKGLDDVILAMREGRGTAPERLRAAYRRAGGGDLRGDIRRHVEAGEDLALPADLFGPCGRIETSRAEAADGRAVQVQQLVLGEGAGSDACRAALAGI